VIGSVEEIERGILLREVLAQLSPEERLICVWKKAGYSSQEIAQYQGRSVSAVDTLLCRARQKIRRLLGVEPADSESDKLVRGDDGSLADQQALRRRENDEANVARLEASPPER
jgi:DNA-binding CsgD family transcriptional regulator